MKYVSALNKPEEITLQWMARRHPLQWTRIRAHSVLFSSNGCSLNTLSYTFGICRQTISIWLNSWEKEGLCGLIDKPGRGRHKKILLEKELEVVEIITKFPRSLKTVLQEIHKLWGVKISLSTLKRICKKAGLIWKRVRKSLRGKRNDEKFYAALNQIKALLEKENNGEIDFYYFDESGFSLEPCVPYAWPAILDLATHFPSENSKPESTCF
jgi:transposase